MPVRQAHLQKALKDMILFLVKKETQGSSIHC